MSKSCTKEPAVEKKVVIAGIDEAGRGPLAGPVVAGACVLTSPLLLLQKTWPCWTPLGTEIKETAEGPELVEWEETNEFEEVLIADSKKLTEEQREVSFAWITTHCPFGIGIVHAEEIDRIGILEATQKAMQDAVAMLAKTITPTYLLVDGRDCIWFDYSHSSIIDGDQKEPCISAASIVAKVTRDRLMKEYDRVFPPYNFAQHKGYGTPEHLEALTKYGPCSIHRMTFLALSHTSLPRRGRVRERGLPSM